MVEKGRVRHQFSAQAPNELWLADITEHATAEGELDHCAMKDAYSNRIIGYSIDARMKSRIAVAALNNAVGGGVLGVGSHCRNVGAARRRGPVSNVQETTTGWNRQAIPPRWRVVSGRLGR